MLLLNAQQLPTFTFQDKFLNGSDHLPLVPTQPSSVTILN
jgi:hypothetical protein